MSSIAFSFIPPISSSSHSPSSYSSSKSIPSFSFPSLSLRLRLSPTPSPLCRIQQRRTDLPFILHSSTGGGDGGVGGGSFGGHGGDNGDGGNDGGNIGKEVLLVLAEAGRSLESLPADLAAAIREGKIPASVVARFLELEKSLIFRWLLQFSGFKERLLADDLFLAKVAFECGVGVFTKVSSLLYSSSILFYTHTFLVLSRILLSIQRWTS